MEFQRRAHAVVIGGSIAGLCAARVLGDHFARVTLVERDSLPHGVEHRPGAPQAHHLHLLLLRGLHELERLFPGIENDLAQQGAGRVDLGSDVAHYTEWGWAPRARIDVAPLTMSRLLLESCIRARVFRELPNLTRLEATRVTGLKVRHLTHGTIVTGVRTSDAQRPELEADLVVDASGRNSRALEWLEVHGLPSPPEERVDPLAGYASRFYELAPEPRRWWRGMIIDAKLPTLRRWGMLMPIEDGRVGVTVGGINGEYPPGEESAFHDFVEHLASPALARAIATARPISPIHTHRALSNRARHFERWSSEVGGFIALGDSAVAFNAAYGQGMSMAAAAVNTLNALLRERVSGGVNAPFAFTRRFHREQWRQLRTAWGVATGADLRWPATEGARPRGHALSTALGNMIVRAANHDPDLRRRLGPVVQLLVEPASLLASPSFLTRLVVAEMRRRVGASLLLEAPLEFDETLSH
jgi:2-polyprenyl-6-methoxyphenol hydroxylase-like FAD-dependent oxidoreductase